MRSEGGKGAYMANPIQATIDGLKAAKDDARAWGDDTISSAGAEAARIIGALEAEIDPQIAGRCADVINTASNAIKQAAALAAEEIEQILAAEIRSLDALLG